jgi:cytochrome c oxidase subunit 1
MAIEARQESSHDPDGGSPADPQQARPWWLRPAWHTALVGAVIGYIFGHWLGNFIASGYQQVGTSDDNDFALVLGYAFGVIGWLIGLGVFNDALRQMTGRPLPPGGGEEEHGQGGLAEYFGYSLDHKVVGVQYLVGMLVYFFTGGLFAIAIRTELLSPSYHLMDANSYLMVVGEHGTMMMI